MAPINLIATTIGDTSVQLTWGQPFYTGGGPLRGYRIELSSTGSDFMPIVSFQEETTHTHTGLDVGDTIYFRVFSINDRGSSRSWASVIGYTTCPPPAPIDLLVFPDSETAINLNWGAPNE